MERRAWGRLIASAKSGPVFFPNHAEPLVSIVVPVYNNADFTAMCLNSLLREMDALPCEVIVVDDASTDGTAEYLQSCSGLRVVRHVMNQGFVQSANDGAAVARGRYLHFLNNDTIVTPGWLRPLLRTFELRDRVAAVGSQLRAPDLRISDAGGIIWRDGSGTNYARGRRASEAGVAFPREVDYCSGASLTVSTERFREAGGFSREFSPGYYEDADLCFCLRSNGYRVLYQPDSVVIHFEGATAGKNPAARMKRYQALHRDAFARKWEAELEKHFPPDENLIERAARRIAGKHTILAMDSFVPFEDRSAGARRLFAIMALMRELDWHVLFVADDGGMYEPYTTRLRRIGVEVLPHRGDASVTLRDLPAAPDVAWVCRPDLLTKYLPVLRAATNAKVIYDTVDLHFLRRKREQDVTGRQTYWEAMQTVEVDLARKVDSTIVTSDAERRLLLEAHIPAAVIPIIEQPVQTRAAYSSRSDLLFLANYTHEPNVNAAVWLASEVMPRVWERMPTMRLLLAGADPTPPVQRLAEDRILVAGHVPDARALFDGARVFVAPLRYGAGMKGKVVQALAHGIPVITTTIGAEGIALASGENAMIADDPQAFADAILHVYNDELSWQNLADGALQAAQAFSPHAVKPALDSVLLAVLEQKVEVGVHVGTSAHTA